jgi:hypothetical protein
VDPEIAEMVYEYHYRQIFHMSHEDYLNEPRGLIDWMIAIHNTMQERDG